MGGWGGGGVFTPGLPPGGNFPPNKIFFLQSGGGVVMGEDRKGQTELPEGLDVDMTD